MRTLPGCAALTLFTLLAGATPAHGQRCLPFGAGERLTYGIRVSMLGAKGQAVMSVSGPVELRGRVVLQLKSDASVGVGFLSGSDQTRSWVEPLSFATLRFVQKERHVIARGIDSVEVFPEQRRWFRGDGTAGAMRTESPVDVLSFIYLLRTLQFGIDTAWTFERHFDDRRNPTTVRVIGRDSIVTPAGRFDAWQLHMQVKDTAHYGGDGVIRLHISSDDRRLPVRIESVMPIVGTTVMTLSSVVPPPVGACSALPRVVAGR